MINDADELQSCTEANEEYQNAKDTKGGDRLAAFINATISTRADLGRGLRTSPPARR